MGTTLKRTVWAVLAVASPAFAKDVVISEVPASSLDPLVLAAHLTRPEVIDGCLKEIKESKYEFVRQAIETKEVRNPVNVTIKLNALLIEKATGTKKGRQIDIDGLS
jgi:hypothetical protein